MIRVTVDLIPGGVGRPKRLKRFFIANDGSGSHSIGNYSVYFAPHDKVKGHVTRHQRQKLSVLRLVARACESLADEWKIHLAKRRTP